MERNEDFWEKATNYELSTILIAASKRVAIQDAPLDQEAWGRDLEAISGVMSEIFNRLMNDSGVVETDIYLGPILSELQLKYVSREHYVRQAAYADAVAATIAPFDIPAPPDSLAGGPS